MEPVQRFMPHDMYFVWNAGLLALHVISDAFIALAYFSIAVTLLFFIRKRTNLPFAPVFVMFGFFSIACGATHALEIWTIWHPAYWLSGWLKALTAVASVATAVLLIRIVPAAPALRPPDDLAALNKQLTFSPERDRATVAKLHASNRLMAMAEQMAHVGHWRIDVAANELTWSDEIYRILGRTKTYAPQLESALDSYHPVDQPRVRDIIAGAIDHGSAASFEARIARADGTYRDVVCNGQAERSDSGKVTAVFGVFQDVTERKSNEREREQLIERTRLATQAAQVGVWDWDIATNAIIWNPIMYALYGFADAEFVPSYDHWITALHADDRADAERVIARAAAGEGTFDTEFRVVWQNGEIHNIRAMATLVCDAAGAPARMVGTNWDITEVRNLADLLAAEKTHLLQASADLTEANRAKSDFLARMSHEIRTPMNGIIGFATLVLETELTDRQREHLTYLNDAGKSLMAIINDVLDFSKIEAGKLELERIPLAPRAVVDGALSIMETAAEI